MLRRKANPQDRRRKDMPPKIKQYTTKQMIETIANALGMSFDEIINIPHKKMVELFDEVKELEARKARLEIEKILIESKTFL
jgi:hypothetical protein